MSNQPMPYDTPLHIAIKFFIGAIVASCLIAFVHNLLKEDKPTAARGLASKPDSMIIAPEKTKDFTSLNSFEIAISGKRHSPLEVQILGDTKSPSEVGRPFRLRGIITPAMGSDLIKIKWVLPPQVQMLSGQIEDEINRAQKGESKEFEVTVVSNTAENQQIHLTAYEVINGENVGNIAQYNTVLQPVVNTTDQTVDKMHSEGANQEPAQSTFVQ